METIYTDPETLLQNHPLYHTSPPNLNGYAQGLQHAHQNDTAWCTDSMEFNLWHGWLHCWLLCADWRHHRQVEAWAHCVHPRWPWVGAVGSVAQCSEGTLTVWLCCDPVTCYRSSRTQHCTFHMVHRTSQWLYLLWTISMKNSPTIYSWRTPWTQQFEPQLALQKRCSTDIMNKRISLSCIALQWASSSASIERTYSSSFR